MQNLAIRNAVNNLIQFTSELGKYKAEGIKKEIFEECRENLIILFHPIAPHMTEEIWEIIGKKGYLSLNPWVYYNKDLLTEESDYKWKLMNTILNDINNIKIVMRTEKLNSVSIIVADGWKLKFYKTLMSLLEETKNQGEIMNKLMQNNDLKKYSKQIGKIVSRILKNVGKFPKFILSSIEEYDFFDEIKPIIEMKFGCSVKVIFEKDSSEQKASQALPSKPAIVII
jgi:leucyl-tRNA synthetase